MTLDEAGEDNVVRALCSTLTLRGDVMVGPGDDCAVLENVTDPSSYDLLKTDSVIEGVHYTPDTCPQRVGWKAMARNISDIAAMGGTPKHALISLTVPGDRTLKDLEKLYEGLQNAATAFGISIVGGETSRSPVSQLSVISVTLTGVVAKEHLALRSAAQPGDFIVVTGTLGGSISGKHLDFMPRLKEAAHLVRHDGLHSMMDLSDGIAKDLPRLANASNAGFILDREALPCNDGSGIREALTDGEDYELLATMSPKTYQAVNINWPFKEVPLTKIGHIVATSKGETLDGGWDPFQQ